MSDLTKDLAVVDGTLEWYASDPRVWVSFAPNEYQKQFDEANQSPYLTRIGDDNRGHPQFVPNEVKAEHAMEAWSSLKATIQQNAEDAKRLLAIERLLEAKTALLNSFVKEVNAAGCEQAQWKWDR